MKEERKDVSIEIQWEDGGTMAVNSFSCLCGKKNEFERLFIGEAGDKLECVFCRRIYIIKEIHRIWIELDVQDNNLKYHRIETEEREWRK